MEEFAEGGQAQPSDGLLGKLGNSDEVSLLKSNTRDWPDAIMAAAAKLRRDEEISLDQKIRNLPWVKRCGSQPYKDVLEKCWHEFGIKNRYLNAVNGDRASGRLRGVRGRAANTPTQLFTKGVAALCLPSVQEQKSELPDHPNTCLAEGSVVEIVKAFNIRAELMADALVWAENLIVLYESNLELYEGIWTGSSSTQRNIAIAKGLTRRLLADELPDFSRSNEATRHKALIGVLQEKTGITSIAQVKERLTDLTPSLEEIVSDEWREFGQRDRDLTDFDVFLQELLSCKSIISSVPKESRWWRKYELLVGYETKGQDELSIWLAKQALTTNSGLADSNGSSSLTKCPCVRKATNSGNRFERLSGRVVPPLGLSLEERFTEHFRSRDVGERIRADDLPELLTDEAYRTSTWLGLSCFKSRLCLAVSIKVGKELYGYVDAKLDQASSSAIGVSLRNTPALSTTRAVAAHFLGNKLIRNHFSKIIEEKNLYNLKDGENLRAMRQRRAIASKTLGERLENLEAIVPNRVWRQVHLQEIYGAPIGNGDNLGRIIGADVRNLVRQLSSEWAKNASQPIDQHLPEVTNRLPLNPSSEYSANELMMYLKASTNELRESQELDDQLMLRIRDNLLHVIVCRGDELFGENREVRQQTGIDPDQDWRVEWNAILTHADQENDKLGEYMRSTSPQQVDGWLKKNWSN